MSDTPCTDAIHPDHETLPTRQSHSHWLLERNLNEANRRIEVLEAVRAAAMALVKNGENAGQDKALCRATDAMALVSALQRAQGWRVTAGTVMDNITGKPVEGSDE